MKIVRERYEVCELSKWWLLLRNLATVFRDEVSPVFIDHTNRTTYIDWLLKLRWN